MATGGPLIFNLGCGEKVSPLCVNIDNSLLLRLKRSALPEFMLRPLMPQNLRTRLAKIPDCVVRHNLKRGIPAQTASVDVVYHCHLLEHLDRWEAAALFEEIFRVLVPGGVCRVVVPDLEQKVRRYLQHLLLCERQPGEASVHDRYVASLFEQCVRRDAASTRQHGLIRRRVENLVLGDARRRRETHQWMYDRMNLAQLFLRSGFTDIQVRAWNESAVPEWAAIGLEVRPDGGEHKPASLYMEAVKPR